MAKKTGKKEAKAEAAAPVLAGDATEKQKAAYLEMATNTVAALDDAIALLEARKVAPDLTADERRLINVQLPDHEANRAKVWAQMLAFLAGQQAVRPPSDAQVGKAVELAKQLDGMVASAVVAAAIVQVSGELVTLWKETRG